MIPQTQLPPAEHTALTTTIDDNLSPLVVADGPHAVRGIVIGIAISVFLWMIILGLARTALGAL